MKACPSAYCHAPAGRLGVTCESERKSLRHARTITYEVSGPSDTLSPRVRADRGIPAYTSLAGVVPFHVLGRHFRPAFLDPRVDEMGLNTRVSPIYVPRRVAGIQRRETGIIPAQPEMRARGSVCIRLHSGVQPRASRARERSRSVRRGQGSPAKDPAAGSPILSCMAPNLYRCQALRVRAP